MEVKYVYRIDDIHPAMMWSRFQRVMAMFQERGVVPLLGVIPDNQDKSLQFDPPREDFHQIMRTLVAEKRAEVAQHGYRHLYTTRQQSINQRLYGRVSSSEFAGLPYETQYAMIRDGQAMLRAQGLESDVWMAPSHTSDHHTFRALKNLGFRYVTDGVAVYPYQRHGLIFVPQQNWQSQKPFPMGVFTICLHLDDLEEAAMKEIEAHLKTDDVIIPFSQAAQLPRQWYHGPLNSFFKAKRMAYHLGVRPLRAMKNQAVPHQER